MSSRQAGLTMRCGFPCPVRGKETSAPATLRGLRSLEAGSACRQAVSRHRFSPCERQVRSPRSTPGRRSRAQIMFQDAAIQCMRDLGALRGAYGWNARKRRHQMKRRPFNDPRGAAGFGMERSVDTVSSDFCPCMATALNGPAARSHSGSRMTQGGRQIISTA